MKIERKYLAHYINVAQDGEAVYERLGQDLETFAPEIWIVADTLSVTLCLTQGMWWMALLYIMYVIAAVIGLIHWKKHGEYVHSC